MLDLCVTAPGPPRACGLERHPEPADRLAPGPSAGPPPVAFATVWFISV